MTPKLTLIISFYNKIDLLKKVLDTAKYQTFKDFEVVVADDGSRSEVVDELHCLQTAYPFPIAHVWQEDQGWQKNKILNKAVVAAKSEYLVFIDGDCLLDKHFLEDHYGSRRHGEVVTGRRVMLTRSLTDRLMSQAITERSLGLGLFFNLLYSTLFLHEKTQMEQMLRLSACLRKIFIHERKRHILGCNFSLYKEDLLSVNGFDERFAYPGYGEDIDLWQRLGRKGIISVSRKCQLVQYHCFHKHFDTNYAPNQALMQENTDNNVSYTPYGIIRESGRSK